MAKTQSITVTHIITLDGRDPFEVKVEGAFVDSATGGTWTLNSLLGGEAFERRIVAMSAEVSIVQECADFIRRAEDHAQRLLG